MAQPAQLANEAPGLYVHVPFCVRKCRYCGFFSEVDLRDRAGWVASVLQEAASYRDRFAPFDTLYLGGGTPSVLSDPDLDVLVKGLRRSLAMVPDIEISMEVNPGDVSLERAKRWTGMGIRRASVGVQSFDDTVLTFLGRRHDAATASRVLVDLRTAGFESIGVDLIWGIPGQQPESSLASLERALSFRPEHLSCYELTVEEGTSLARDVADGRVAQVSDEAAADLALAFWNRLQAAGYEHYEVSNFARDASHRSRHNRKYWRHVPYLGLGPAAHSFDGRARWSNVPSVSAYRAAVLREGTAMGFEESLTPEQLRFEGIALGMRTAWGVAAEWVRGQRVQALLDDGLVAEQGERIVPTTKGMLMADALALALIDDRRSRGPEP